MRSPESYGFMTIEYAPVNSFKIALTGTYTGKMLVPHLGGTLSSQDQLDELINNNDIDAYNLAFAVNQAIENGDIIEGEKLEISFSLSSSFLKSKF